ncbi:hypothetical protein C0Q70_20078 [Pomacea canaliculata]|uniref:Uncharacterized protein n=1 Tax=Pomacea canaliculata TaxID=400727 RepID=A0A2T7NEI5_POMCA|nr:hypothetical protein C0Q70_20078 [Pomacea canaliculata]
MSRPLPGGKDDVSFLGHTSLPSSEDSRADRRVRFAGNKKKMSAWSSLSEFKQKEYFLEYGVFINYPPGGPPVVYAPSDARGSRQACRTDCVLHTPASAANTNKSVWTFCSYNRGGVSEDKERDHENGTKTFCIEKIWKIRTGQNRRHPPSHPSASSPLRMPTRIGFPHPNHLPVIKSLGP